jgi:transcriptional regulator with XRE-family HTH domain
MSDKAKEKDYEKLVEQETLIFEATEVISELIEAAGLTKKEVAEKLGRSKGFVTQVLSGERNMTLRTLSDFAFALEHRITVEAEPLHQAQDGGEGDFNPGAATARVVDIGGFVIDTALRGDEGEPRRQEAVEELASPWSFRGHAVIALPVGYDCPPDGETPVEHQAEFELVG